MKKIMLFASMLLAFATAADARIITYTWHQTSTTWPGLDFTAYYKVMQGAAPLPANSSDPSPDFGGLVDFYIQGGSYPAITLASLVPPCFDIGGCTSGGADHAWGYPFWQINIPYLLYVNAYDLPDEPFHVEWEYWATSTSILIGDDNGNHRCWDTALCTATGYWVSDFVPEPMTLFAFLGGLALLGTRPLRRRQHG